MIYEETPTIQGSTNHDVAFLGSHDKYIEGQFITVFGEDSQLVQTELLCYSFNLLNPTGHVKHQQFNIQQLYVLPTLHLCVLYLSENKQRIVPLIS